MIPPQDIRFRAKRVDRDTLVSGYYFKTPLTSEVYNDRRDGHYFLDDKPRHCIAENGCAFEIDPSTLEMVVAPQDSVNTLTDADKILRHKTDMIREFANEHSEFHIQNTVSLKREYIQRYIDESYERGRADERVKLAAEKLTTTISFADMLSKTPEELVAMMPSMRKVEPSPGRADERAKLAEPGDWEKEFDERFVRVGSNGVLLNSDDDEVGRTLADKIKSFFASVIAQKVAEAEDRVRREQIEKDAELVRGFTSWDGEYACDVVRNQLTPATLGSNPQPNENATF